MANQLPADHPSAKEHKRQFAFQILVPIILFAALIIAGAVVVTTGGTSQTGVWSDVSLIWLLIPAISAAFTILAVIITIIYGMSKMLQIIPRYTWKAQGFFSRISEGTRRVADGTTKPFFWYKQAGAIIKSLFRW